ncbi:hypothetical protein [Candidatus Paracaedibacter symbiosus]|uniref:hypothetical protein n=1 Tax=Candidatus Paracaedibacter symbiosus TaxID=244582 RepID=UPI0005097B8B|nr:hypothetical protein [Candidatus Paracaedibacter symbiosus]
MAFKNYWRVLHRLTSSLMVGTILTNSFIPLAQAMEQLEQERRMVPTPPQTPSAREENLPDQLMIKHQRQLQDLYQKILRAAKVEGESDPVEETWLFLGQKKGKNSSEIDPRLTEELKNILQAPEILASQNRLEETLRKLQEPPILKILPAELVNRIKTFYKSYADKFKSATPEKQKALLEPKAVLTLDTLDSYRLSQARAREILSMSAEGVISKKNPDGNHPVTELGEVFFKGAEDSKMPLCPTLESAMGAFQTFLTGQGMTPSTFLTLKNVGTFPQKIYPLQAAPKVNGKSFAAHYQKLRGDLSNLSSSSVSALFLTSLLTNPEDGKADNFFVDEDYNLVGIDNDMALAPSILWKVNPYEKEESHSIGVKTILYLLPGLEDRSLDSEIRKRVLSWDPGLFVTQWLGGLQARNKSYKALFGGQPIPSEFLEGIPLHLPSFLSMDLFKKIQQLQGYLNNHADAKLEDILAFMDPLVSQYYGRLRKLNNNPVEAYRYLVKDQDSNSLTHEVLLEEILSPRAEVLIHTEDKSLQKSLVYQALRREQTDKHEMKEILGQNSTNVLSPQKQVQALFKEINFQELSSLLQGRYLITLQKFFPKVLKEVPETWRLNDLAQKILTESFSFEDRLHLYPALKALGIALPEDHLYKVLALNGQDEDKAVEELNAILSFGVLPEALNTLNSLGKSPLDLSLEYDFEKVFQRLIDAGVYKIQAKKAASFYVKGKLGERDEDDATLKAYRRLEIKNRAVEWETALEVLMPISEDENAPIRTVDGDKREMPENVRGALFHEVTGKIKKVNEGKGRSAVGRVMRGPYELYFKEFPELPGTEEAVRLLNLAIAGHDSFFSKLIRYGNKPYLVSLGVKGKNLADIFEEHAKKVEKVKKLNPHQAAKLVPEGIMNLDPKNDG